MEKVEITLEVPLDFLERLNTYPFNWSIMFEKNMERLMKRYDEYNTIENQINLQHARHTGNI